MISTAIAVPSLRTRAVLQCPSDGTALLSLSKSLECRGGSGGVGVAGGGRYCTCGVVAVDVVEVGGEEVGRAVGAWKIGCA